MGKYAVSDSSLSAVANAIRTRGGTSEPLAFPVGFVSAVEAIPTGGNTDAEDSLVMRTISGTYENSRVTEIGGYAFTRCISLTGVSFSACTEIGSSAFYLCSSLTTVNFPLCENIRNYAFSGCANLSSVSFPACTEIGSNAFYACTSLSTVNFRACTRVLGSAFYRCIRLADVSFSACALIGVSAFAGCNRLISLYLTGSSLCALVNSNAFQSTPIGGYSVSAGQYGSIYVPASLLSDYQTASNWSYFSSRFVGLTDAEIEALEG